MTYRSKVSLSHYYLIFLLFPIPVAILVIFNILTGLPPIISFGVWGLGIMIWTCALFILSNILKTNYVLDDDALIINWNREKPLVIDYDDIISFEIKTNKTKYLPNIVSYARSKKVVHIKYIDKTGKHITIEISPEDRRNFIRGLAKMKDENIIIYDAQSENPLKENEENNKNEDETMIVDYHDSGAFSVKLPKKFYDEIEGNYSDKESYDEDYEEE